MPDTGGRPFHGLLGTQRKNKHTPLPVILIFFAESVFPQILNRRISSLVTNKGVFLIPKAAAAFVSLMRLISYLLYKE